MSDMVEIGALWKNDGKDHLSGKLGNATLLVFPNNYKKHANEPDFRVFVAPARKKERTEGERALVDSPEVPTPRETGTVKPLDDIPF